MTNLQLLLAIGLPAFIPTFAVIVGIIISNGRLTAIESRLIAIENDLRQFFKDLGKHEGKIEMLEHRK